MEQVATPHFHGLSAGRLPGRIKLLVDGHREGMKIASGAPIGAFRNSLTPPIFRSSRYRSMASCPKTRTLES